MKKLREEMIAYLKEHPIDFGYTIGSSSIFGYGMPNY